MLNEAEAQVVGLTPREAHRLRDRGDVGSAGGRRGRCESSLRALAE